MELFERFLEEDRAKTESIAQLSKAVLDLAEEVKKLKKGYDFGHLIFLLPDLQFAVFTYMIKISIGMN